MAQQKEFIAKVYDQDGTTFLNSFVFSPEGASTLKALPTFRSTINGGLGECVLDIDLPFDDFDEDEINLMNIVDIWVTDANNTRGRRVYRGFMSQIAPYIDPQQGEGVQVTLLGLVSLLAFSHYKSGSSFEVTHTSEDPEDIAQSIIDHFNSIYSGSLLSYSGTTSTVGEAVSITFTDQTWAEAIQKTVELAGTDWWWKIDADGYLHFKAKPGSATHTFTIGKDIESIRAPKDAETVINDVQIRRDGGTATDYSDVSSQATYGTGSPPTGKRTSIINDSSLTDANAADQRGNKEINDKKDAKVKSPFAVNTNYDLESIKVGDTCKIVNLKYGNTFFSTNMLIVALTYNGDTVDIEVEQEGANIGHELTGIITSISGGSSGSSGGGGGGSSDAVDNETPAGTVNGSNVTFTLSQTPESGSVKLYLNGVRQYPTTDFSMSGQTITYVTAPLTGFTHVADYRITASTTAADNEVPSGTVNGVNVTFTLANSAASGSVHLYLNGQRQYLTTDFTVSGDTITFVTAPPTGSTLIADYTF